jgi:hypothetical protein
MRQQLSYAIGTVTDAEYHFAIEQVWRNEEQTGKKFDTLTALEHMRQSILFLRKHGGG